jgi:hypothetical protein
MSEEQPTNATPSEATPTTTEVVPPATTPAPAAPAAPNQPKAKTPEDELANKLCIASLICYFGPTVLSVFFAPLMGAFEDVLDSSSSPVGNVFTLPIGAILGLAPIAGIVLMIIARVKAPKNTFAKVLMWIYIGLFILEILVAVAFILFFGALLASCASGLN